MQKLLPALLFSAVIALTSFSSSQTSVGQSNFKLPSCFNDNMVVQRDKPIAIWGWTTANASVLAEFHGNTTTTNADETGYWKLVLPALAANSNAAILKITSGENQVEITNVLVGEVWFASGQSNMAWNLKATENFEEVKAASDYPAFRMFQGTTTPASEPQTDIKGEWKVCTPENAGMFSATAYYFARKIHQETGVPVGIIKSVWGGKRCECYCSREAMLTNENGIQMIAELDKQTAAYDPEKGKLQFEKAMTNWKKKADEIRKANADLPKDKRKRLPRKPNNPTSPMMNPGNPTVLYNGMINPLVGYNMRGAIWYQGEANCRDNLAPIYKEMMELMIQDWRTRWNDEFPFYYVQLANFRKPTTEPGVDDTWATVQDQQRLTLTFPKTGMATINDIGMAGNIHPTNKKDVGERLARWALKNEYGKDVVVSGPLYQSASFNGSKATISFNHLGGGLKSRDGKPLQRFEIAGEDKKWHWGEANIEGDYVVVTSDAVPNPVAVRYAWASNPEGANLINAEGLPASVFRTDDWKFAFEEENK